MSSSINKSTSKRNTNMNMETRAYESYFVYKLWKIFPSQLPVSHYFLEVAVAGPVDDFLESSTFS